MTRGRYRLQRDTNQLGANFLFTPPNHPVCATLERTIAVEEQSKFVGNFKSIGMDPHAPVGDVGNDAVERRGADPELDLRERYPGASFVVCPQTSAT